ncbi:hypothetical protein Tco_1429822 [Tanacetum coccineum]
MSVIAEQLLRTVRYRTTLVALDTLKLTPVYNAFEVSTDVPEIYMQEFWATVTKHHYSLWFKLNGKSHTIKVDNFRDMLKICPELTGQKFEEPPFEEEILPLIRDLGHTCDIKEDFMFQVENKDSKKNNDMFYPCFTKVIVDYFMAKDPSISRRKKMFWHTARDDSMFTTIKTSSKGAQSTKEQANQLLTKYKAKGLTLPSGVALTKDEQMKLATKRSRIQTHNSHASGSSDGVDTLSKIVRKSLELLVTVITMRMLMKNDQDEEENVEDEEKAEDDEDMSDQRVHTPPDYQLFEKSGNQEDNDVEDGE